nr:reverse transcriptase domain-containing protein [Tanacetum cinerariifolium]
MTKPYSSHQFIANCFIAGNFKKEVEDSLNSAAGGNFLDKMPADCLKIIKSKSKVHQTRAKAVVAKVNLNSSTPAVSSDVAELKDMVRALLLDKKNQYPAPTPSPTPAPIKAVEPNCVTCGVANYGQGNTGFQPQMVANQIRPPEFLPVNQPLAYQAPAYQAPVPQTQNMSFKISFTDALMLMPKFTSTLKALIGNKEKLNEMAKTPMNEHCSAVILNKLPKKLGDPGKFLIPCEFSGMDECLALADLGASINLMPLSVWKGLSLPELTSTCMTFELADRTESKPIDIAKDVKVKVGMFHFPADFVVVDFEPDSRVPLIFGRCFLMTGRALIDVHKDELTLCIGNEAITYNLDQTSRYSTNYDQMMANKIDVTDEACEEYSQEVLGFSDVTTSGSPTPSDNPIISTTSPTLTLFGDSDLLLFEEADAFLGLEDDPDSPELDPSYYDPEGDILLLEAILNSDPLPPLLNHEQSVPSFKHELKACEAKTIKSSIDEPPEVELKDLPLHLEYAFLEGDNKFPVIIAKELGDEEKSALIKVLKSHKRAIAWKLSDIEGINPEFYTHKILMEEDYKLAVQHQRRVNLKIHDVIKKEGTSTIVSSMVSPGISKSPLTHVIRKRLHSHAPMGCSPIVACLSVYAMRQARFKGDTPFVFSEDCIKAFQTLKKKLTEAPILIAPNWDLPFELMCDASDFAIVHTDHSALKYLFAKKDAKERLLRWVLLLQEFDFDVIDTKGAENLAANHLSRLENSYENVLDPKEINEKFPFETLSMVTFHDDSGAPWFADFANYHAVHQTRAKAVVAKVSSNSSTPTVSSDVAELKDMVRALLLDKKNQYSAQTSSPTPALIKAVEPNCVTCDGNHAYQNCLATSKNVYQDNIQEYVSQAAASRISARSEYSKQFQSGE